MRIVAPFVGGGGGQPDILLANLPDRALGDRWLRTYWEVSITAAELM